MSSTVDLAAWAKKYPAEVGMLVDMGFPEKQAIKALYKTRNVEAAAHYLAEHRPSSPAQFAKAALNDAGARPRNVQTAPVRVKKQIDLLTAAGWVVAKVLRDEVTDKGRTLIVEYPSKDIIKKGKVVWGKKTAPVGTHTGKGGIKLPSRSSSGPYQAKSTRPPKPSKSASASSPKAKGPGPSGPPPKFEWSLASQYDRVDVQKDMFLDVRDTVGKWLEAQVIYKKGSSCRVHFLRWEAKWDEDIDMVAEFWRFADFHKYSAGTKDSTYLLEQAVYVNPPHPPREEEWLRGFVRKVDGPQLQVQFMVGKKKYQYWFHSESREITKEEPTASPPPSPPPYDQAVGKDVDTDSANKADDSDTTKLESSKYWKGQFIEVKDTVGKWLPAEVLIVSKNSIYVHYEGWSARWDEWIHLETDKERVRALGIDIKESVEEKERKAEEEKFRKQLKETQGYTILDCDKDGNCMFRSVAHQIYNDPELHKQVREACYDYMVDNKSFFSQYIAEDFDTYIKRQRQQNQWGDHVELVALREMFNKNLEIFDKDSVIAPKPLGLAADVADLPIIRLSYHGSSHYNSVVDPKNPPPLGDGKDSTVSLRALRLAQEEEERSRAAAAATTSDKEPSSGPAPDPAADAKDRDHLSPSPLGSVRIRRAGSSSALLRTKLQTTSTITDADFNQAWTDVAGTSDVLISEDSMQTLVHSLLKKLYTKRRSEYESWANLKDKRSKMAARAMESLDKAYDEAEQAVDEYADRLLDHCQHQPDAAKNGKLAKGCVSRMFMQHTKGDMDWDLNKGN